MRCGDTLFFDPGRRTNPHLWIVVTAPEAPDFLCVIVSVTTLRNNCDQTVTLRKDDHSALKWDSVVSYMDAQIVHSPLLDQAVRETSVQRDACSADVLKLVQQGITASP